MELFTTLAMAGKHILGLIQSKEARKYVDRILELERLKYEELKKAAGDIDHGFLDNIDSELCLIVKIAPSLQGTST